MRDRARYGRGEKRPFIFIVTYGRSGSTLLQRVIGSIPGYLIRGENNDALYYLYKSCSNLSYAQDWRKDREITADDPWHGIKLIDTTGYARQLARIFIRSVIRPSSSDRVIGFKEIRYIWHMEELESYLDFLLRTFLRSKIVFNIRRAEDAAKSASFWEIPFEKTVAMIRECDELFQSYAKKHGDRCYLVKYDEYVADPDLLRGLHDFLGEPFDRKRIDDVLKVRTSVGRPS